MNSKLRVANLHSVVLASLLLICLPGVDGSPAYAHAQHAAAAASPRLSTTYEVTYTPATVVLDPAVVDKALKNVSADGVTYRFAGSVSQLKGLHAGSILLIGGKALRTVKSVSSSGGDMVVTTGTAGLLQAIKNGKIGWNYDVPFGSALRSSGLSISVGAGLHLVRGAALKTDGRANLAVAVGASSQAASGPITYHGPIGGYDVDLTFDESSLAGLIVKVVAKKKDGSMAIRAEGHLHTLDDSMDLLIMNSHLNNFRYHQGDLSGDMKLEWHAYTSSAGAETLMDDAAFKIPVAFTVPFLVGPIPVSFAIKANLAVAPAIDDKRGSSGGSITVEYNTTENIVGNGAGVTASGTLGKARFSISGETVTAGYIPTGLGMDVEFPRVELSILGIVTTFVSLNAHAYGFFTPGTTLTADIKPCQKAGGSLKGFAGANMSLFGLFKINLGVKELFKSQDWVQYKDGKKCD